MPTAQMAARALPPMCRVVSPPRCLAAHFSALSSLVSSPTALGVRLPSRSVPSSGALVPSSRALLKTSLCSSSVVSSTVLLSVFARLKFLSMSPNWLLPPSVDVSLVLNSGPLLGVCCSSVQVDMS